MSRAPIAHCRSRPPVSETQAVLTALEYARETGAPLHLCHLSLARSVDLARCYAREGLQVSTETCPHYLCFSERTWSAKVVASRSTHPCERRARWPVSGSTSCAGTSTSSPRTMPPGRFRTRPVRRFSRTTQVLPGSRRLSRCLPAGLHRTEVRRLTGSRRDCWRPRRHGYSGSAHSQGLPQSWHGRRRHGFRPRAPFTLDEADHALERRLEPLSRDGAARPGRADGLAGRSGLGRLDGLARRRRAGPRRGARSRRARQGA